MFLLSSENQCLFIIVTTSKVPDSSLAWPRIQIFPYYFYDLSTLRFYFREKHPSSSGLTAVRIYQQRYVCFKIVTTIFSLPATNYSAFELSPLKEANSCIQQPGVSFVNFFPLPYPQLTSRWIILPCNSKLRRLYFPFAIPFASSQALF